MKDKTITIMGLGQYKKGSGVSAAKFLAPKCKKLIVTDMKTKGELEKNVKALEKFKNIVWHLGGHKKEDFVKTDWVIRNPGVRADNEFLKLARKNKIPIDNDITLFLRELGSTENIVGVTGTRGKTTTAHLVHAMIEEERPGALLGGNVGESPLNWITKEKSPIVLELSSFLLHDFASIKQSPHISVFTNIYPDHLNAYSSMEKYIADKKNIYKYQSEDDFLVVNDDDPGLKKMAPESEGKILRFSTRRRLKNGCYIAGGKIMYTRHLESVSGFVKTEDGVCNTKDFHIPGNHNISNLLAAICAAKAYGISSMAIKRAVKDFRGIPYRLELIRMIDGVKYINDTTATTPEGAIAGLKSFPRGKIVLITGGNSKGLSLKEFSKEINACVKKVIKCPGDANADLPYGIDVADMKEAINAAAEETNRGDIVLFSPGLTWLPEINEFERGDLFSELVRELK